MSSGGTYFRKLHSPCGRFGEQEFAWLRSSAIVCPIAASIEISPQPHDAAIGVVEYLSSGNGYCWIEGNRSGHPK